MWQRSRVVYLDYNATAPLDELAKAAMIDALLEFGNPSSSHRAGRRARQLVETARQSLAELTSTEPGDWLFTSGGTEANALAAASLPRLSRNRSLLFDPLGHPSLFGGKQPLAVVGAVSANPSSGHPVDVSLDSFAAAIDALGRIDTSALAGQLTTLGRGVATFVSAANHETGVRQGLETLSAVCRDHGALLHIDAVQLFGKALFEPRTLGCVTASVSAHKIGGPKGVGALYVQRGVDLAPLLLGGGQERGRRAGTENVIGIVGFGAAVRAVMQRGYLWRARLALWRKRIEAIVATLNGRVHCGDAVDSERDEGTLNFSLPGVRGDLLMQSFDLEGIYLSTGSACSSGSLAPSPVITALYGESCAREAIRLSMGTETREEDIAALIERLPIIAERIRGAAR